MSRRPEHHLEAEQLYEFLKSMPSATYAQIDDALGLKEKGIKPNSLVKKLQRQGRITAEKDKKQGKWVGSKKEIL